ncbi:hypothetical protein [Virgibacillus dakarensis]|uniref:hypothetical protein n=1 Tax=Virgibacillus dakarensis TaxID=1917889 RepID=UPI000B44C88D|nr:hypothetical protein [Virgibacillus dakarensis]
MQWAKKGIATVGPAVNEMAFRNQYSQGRRDRGYGAKDEVVPEWFLEQKRKEGEGAGKGSGAVVMTDEWLLGELGGRKLKRVA